MRDLASALLIPFNFPVNMKVLLARVPSFLITDASLILRTLYSWLIIFRLVLFEKKFLIELICVSPIPSILTNSSNFLFFNKLRKFEDVFKFLEINLAFSKPMCRIPSEYMNLSKDILVFSFIEYLRFAIDNFPHPSNFSILS